MEISMFEMWLFFTFLPNLGNVAGAFLVFSSIFLFIGLCVRLVNGYYKGSKYSDEAEKAIHTLQSLEKPLQICFGVWLCSAFLAASTPTKQEMAAIVIVPAITQNKSLQDLGSAGTDMLTEQFKQWTKEIMEQDKT